MLCVCVCVWTHKRMVNPETERELKRLNIDTKEEQLLVNHGGWRLRTRTVKVPLVPTQHSSCVSLNVLHNVTSPSGPDTTDAESIQTCLQFVTDQLQKWYHIVSDVADTTSVDSSPPTLQHEGDFTQHHTPSSEGYYLIWQRINQDPHDSLYQHTTPPKKDMENLRNQ